MDNDDKQRKTEVRITFPNSNLEFKTPATIVVDDEKGVSLEDINAIHRDGKLIVFGNIKANIEFENDGKHYEAKLCQLSKERGEDGWCYHTDAEVKQVNRRNAIRTPYGEQVVFQRGANKGYVSAMTFDVSLTGVGITVPNGCVENLREGILCSISITVGERIIKTEGRIVRIAPIPNDDRTRVGFAVDRPSSQYTSFVMALQRKEAQRNKKE